MSILAKSPNPDTRAFIAALAKDSNIPLKTLELEGIINVFDALSFEHPQLPCELEHFTMPGMMARFTVLRAGTICTTAMHGQWHPYVIFYGRCDILEEVTDDKGRVTYQVKHIHAVDAPNGHFCSITEPGTRRLIIVHEDTKWATFHPTHLTDPAEMKLAITIPIQNRLIGNAAESHIPEASRPENFESHPAQLML
jgi:hypothetical protein